MSQTEPFWRHAKPLVLASGSTIRAQLLRNLGVPLIIHPADIDERAISIPNLEQSARVLAQAKSLAVSHLYPENLVLGADQTLTFEGQLLHKPASLSEARHQLARLSGKAHVLNSAACLTKNGETLSLMNDSATIQFRPLTPKLIESYLAAMGDIVLTSVGCYQLEGLGPHVIDHIDGDHATILGLPLWQLMQNLRALDCLL